MAVKTIVGLDIGSTHIRGVEAVNQNDKIHVKGFASITLEPGIVSLGEIRDAGRLTEALTALWKKGKFSSTDVRVVVNGENNIASLMSLDEEKDFAQTLPFKINNTIFNVEEYYIGYHTIDIYPQQERDTTSPTGVKTVMKRDILLAGSKKDTTDLLISALRSANLRPISIDIAPLAIIRAESIDDTVEENGVDVHVNIGASMTTIVISHNNQPVYLRSIADLGGNTITKAIMSRLEVDKDYAEKLKRHTVNMNPRNRFQSAAPVNAPRNLFDDDEEETTGETTDVAVSAPEPDSADQMNAYRVVVEELSGIVNNIQATVEFFAQSNPSRLGDNINFIFVSGGTARFEQIRQRLAREIGRGNAVLSRPVSILQERGQIGKVSQEILNDEHEYVLAIGAALAKGEEQK